jgi:hypothetical protein
VEKRLMNTTQLNSIAGKKIEVSKINFFEKELKGNLIRPQNSEYEQARKIWNGMIDKQPALIAQCTSPNDVVTCVDFARENNVRVAVRGGGHNVAGSAMSDGGLVIELSGMKNIIVDVGKKTVIAEAGLTLGELDRETQKYCFAVPTGVISKTGISGLTLGGGFGWLSRKYGLTCDNLISAEVVTAAGQMLTASYQQNEDLFWGIRGGGGNFGIVTSFKFKLYPVSEVLGGPIFFNGEKRKEVFKFYRDFIKTVPDELSTIILSITAPPVPFLPKSVHGKRLVVIDVFYDGLLSEGEVLLKPLRKFLKPVVDLIQPMPYLVRQTLNDSMEPSGFNCYWKSHCFEDFSDEAINVIDSYCNSVTSNLSNLVIHQVGGAIRKIGEKETAYKNRKAGYILVIASKWVAKAENEMHIHWTGQFWNALKPYSSGSTYVNFMVNEGEESVKLAYGESNYARLVKLKDKYDPMNFFRYNQNIKPAIKI